MKNIYRILVFTFSLLNCAIAAASDNSHQFFDSALSIELPSDIKELSKKSIKKRYGHQATPPNYAFADRSNSVSFTFTQYATPAEKSNMTKIHKTLSNMLRKANGDASWKKDKTYTKLGTKVAVYEYEISGIGKYQYNVSYVLPVNGKLTFISFKTTEKKYKNKWLDEARQSFESITLAPTD